MPQKVEALQRNKIMLENYNFLCFVLNPKHRHIDRAVTPNASPASFISFDKCFPASMFFQREQESTLIKSQRFGMIQKITLIQKIQKSVSDSSTYLQLHEYAAFRSLIHIMRCVLVDSLDMYQLIESKALRVQYHRMSTFHCTFSFFRKFIQICFQVCFITFTCFIQQSRNDRVICFSDISKIIMPDS